MELATLRVAAALEAAGIANVPLKGPLLARSLHGDPGMRFSRDIDVLVARADLRPRRAPRSSRSAGARSDGAGDPVLHLALTHDAGLPEVELHWRMHWYETRVRRARAGARAARARRRAPPAGALDELAALLLYHARDGFAGLRHPIDAAAWWDAHADAHGPPLLAPIAARAPGARRAPSSASATVLDELVGRARRPPRARRRRLTWGARRAVALANPLMHGEPQQITAEITLVDGLLAPAGERGAFVRRRVLPSPRELPARTARRPLAVARDRARTTTRHGAVRWP